MTLTDHMVGTEVAVPDVVDAELVDSPTLALVPAPLSARAEARRRNAHSDNTTRAYRRHVANYETWCQAVGREPWLVDPVGNTLAEFVSHLCDQSASRATINQAIAAVRSAYTQLDLPKPGYEQARSVRDGYLRDAPSRPQKRAIPLRVHAMRQMVEHGAPITTARGLRDRLVNALGLSMFGRRSELVGVLIGHVTECERGLEVWLPKSKTDQTGKGDVVNVLPGDHEDTDPVRLWRRWLTLLAERGADVSPGAPLLRAVDRWDRIGVRGRSDAPMTGKGINEVIQRQARLAALPNASGYSAHSLRAGAATEAGLANAPDSAIKEGGRWRSSVYQEYKRAEDKWTDHPLRNVGL